MDDSNIESGAFWARLTDALRKKGLPTTQEAVARLAGVGQSAVQKWTERGLPKLSRATVIAEKLGVSVEYLLTGKGPSVELSEQIGKRPGSPHEPVPVQTGLVPVLGVAQLGADGFWAAGDLGAAGGYVDFKSQDEQAYALKVVGDSMHPRIKSGEYVVAEPSHAYGAGDEVVVVTTDGRAMVKEFVYRREGQVALNSVNNGHGRLTLPEDEIESIHYVVAITKPSLFRPG